MTTFNWVREIDAMEQWCPHVRCLDSSGEGGNGVAATNANHINRIPSYACCVASDCMMWIYLDKESDWGRCGLLHPLNFANPPEEDL